MSKDDNVIPFPSKPIGLPDHCQCPDCRDDEFGECPQCGEVHDLCDCPRCSDACGDCGEFMEDCECE